MKRQVGLWILLLTVGAALGAWAQDIPAPDQNPAPPPVSPQESAQGAGPKQEYTEVDPGKSLDFLGQAVSHSTLSLGMTVQAAYDTNIGTFSNTSFPQASYVLGPHIGITQYRPKFALNLSYDGGLGIYQELENSNTYSQSGSVDLLYQLASRWQAHASDRYSYSADPFGSYFTIVGQPSPNNPNPNVYVPFAATQQNVGELDLSDQLSKHDTLTFNGNQSFRRFSNYTTNISFQGGLYNLVSYSGGANFNHRVSAQLAFGAGYNWTSLDFSHGQQRSGISAIQIFMNYQLNKSWSISGWAGPEHITAKTTLFVFNQFVILYQADWVPAFGVNIGWQDYRQSATLGLSRQISDGGGLLATTTVYNVNAAYRRKLTAKWDGVISGIYSNNASFAASNLNKQLFPDRKYTTLQSALQLTRPITQQINANFAYIYIHETQKNIYFVDASPTYNDNRFSVSVTYSWNHPLGR